MTAPRTPLGYFVPAMGPHANHRLVATLEAWWCEECGQGLSVDDVRHLTESQRAMIAARVSNLRPGGDRKSDQAANLQFDSRSVASAAKSLNVGERGEIAERRMGELLAEMEERGEKATGKGKTALGSKKPTLKTLAISKDEAARAKKLAESTESMVERELPFSARTAQRLMAVARHGVLSKPAHVRLLPPAWGTLYELTKLPEKKLAEAKQGDLFRRCS